MICRSSCDIRVAMYAMGYWNFIRSSTFVGRIVISMYWLMVAIGKHSQRSIRLSRRKSRLASIYNRRRGFWNVRFRHWIQVFLLDGACAPSPMATAANMEFRCIWISREFKGVLVELVLNLGIDAFLLGVGSFSAIAFHMGRTSLAQASTMRALRYRSAFLVNVC